METQAQTPVQAEEQQRDPGVYVLLYNFMGEMNTTKQGNADFAFFESKKEAMAAIEKIGMTNLDRVKLFKGAKEVEIKTRVVFTF